MNLLKPSKPLTASSQVLSSCMGHAFPIPKRTRQMGVDVDVVNSTSLLSGEQGLVMDLLKPGMPLNSQVQVSHLRAMHLPWMDRLRPGRGCGCGQQHLPPQRRAGLVMNLLKPGTPLAAMPLMIFWFRAVRQMHAGALSAVRLCTQLVSALHQQAISMWNGAQARAALGSKYPQQAADDFPTSTAAAPADADKCTVCCRPCEAAS